MQVYRSRRQQAEHDERIVKMLFCLKTIVENLEEIKAMSDEERIGFLNLLCDGDQILMYMVASSLSYIFKRAGES